ncbi:MAG: amidase [Gemmatimonadetes bacterium]|nr:amidase [Gemmatimonadota bacterium]
MTDRPGENETASDRRAFLKTAATLAAAGTVAPGALGARSPEAGDASAGAGIRPDRQEVPSVPLGNGEHPALAYQAYPGGNGVLTERMWREHGSALFARSEIGIASWEGPVPTDPEEIAFLPVHRLAALLRDERVTSSELTAIYLERLKRFDPVLMCAVTILEDRAMEEAAAADAEISAGDWRGPLHGVPYGLKDLFSVPGAPTTWGHGEYAGRVIDEEAEVAVRLRRAGAVLIAKLSTGEFARGDRWYRGRTRNPWNTEEGSSGSSAGPGSATAAGAVAFAIGTETQGSIVSPSRRCGLSALRPTFGLVSRHGGMVLSWSMDKIGPMCRSAFDCALVFNAIRGTSELDPSTVPAPFAFRPDAGIDAYRIGYAEDAPEEALERLRGVGANLVQMTELPSGSSNSLSVESSAAMDYRIAPGGVEPEPVPDDLPGAERRNRTRFRGGRAVRAIDYVNSQRRRLLLMREMEAAMAEVDMFVSGSGQVGLTNQTGNPAVVLPYGFGARNPDADSPTIMPLSTTLVGRLFTDADLLNVAHAFQRETAWHLRRPDTSQLGS